MRRVVIGVLALAATALSGCIRESRIAMPSDLIASTERFEVNGMGFGRRGNFYLAGREGRFTRGADQLSLWNSTFVSNTGAGSFRHAGLEGACRYREREVNVGIVSVTEHPFAYRCALGRAGTQVGELVIEEEAGTSGSMLSMRGRRGFMTFDGVHYEITSIHSDQGGGLAAATPLGYRFEQGGKPVGAVDLNGESKTIFAPRSGGAREAVFAGSLALSVLWDPATL